MRDPMFEGILTRSVRRQLLAAALVDREGNTVALSGELSAAEAEPLIALVMFRMKVPDLAARLFDGEVIGLSDKRELLVAVAKRHLILIAIVRRPDETAIDQVSMLRNTIAALLTPPQQAEVIWAPEGGDLGQGLAGLPVIEYALDAARPRAKA